MVELLIGVREASAPGVEWDDFVRGQPNWTHFHLSGWKTVMNSALGHECIFLEARDGVDELVGVLPLVRVKSVLFGHYLVSMPFLNYGGPLGTEEGVRALVSSARNLADEGRVKLLQLRSRHSQPIDLPVSHHKLTTVLELPEDPELLWSSFRSKLRTKIRRPEKEGVTVHFGPSQLRSFFEVFSQHMRDLGTPTHSEQLFETILDTFSDSTIVGCAYLGDRAIACGFGFVWDGEYEMAWSCALRDFAGIRANMQLYWEFMKEVIDRGVSLFNFGRSTPGSGTHVFKQQWGARDEPLHWYYHSRSGLAAAPSPREGPHSWAPALWRKLPTGVATTLGPRIVRYIP